MIVILDIRNGYNILSMDLLKYNLFTYWIWWTKLSHSKNDAIRIRDVLHVVSLWCYVSFITNIAINITTLYTKFDENIWCWKFPHFVIFKKSEKDSTSFTKIIYLDSQEFYTQDYDRLRESYFRWLTLHVDIFHGVFQMEEMLRNFRQKSK